VSPKNARIEQCARIPNSFGGHHVAAHTFSQQADRAVLFADRIIKSALKKAGLKWYGWHAYRRGLARNLKGLGIDDLVIQRILRHGDVGTTQKSYIKVRDMKVQDAMRQLAQAFEACTGSVQLPEQPKLVN